FQAEDGIRDYKVTGVQTCALPISAELDLHLDFQHPFKAAALAADRSEVTRLPLEGSDRRGPFYSRDEQKQRQDNEEHRPEDPWKIGRASCRERVEKEGGAGAIKRK